MSDTCTPHHDLFNTLLTIGLIIGLFVSYIPQHLKIYNKKSSEGFSPWFLLLGATSSGAGMLNMWTLQWGVVRCCRHLTTGSCLESLGGLMQVTLQWALFIIVLVLYMIYYPPHLKYVVVDINNHDMRGQHSVKTNAKSDHWKTSVILSWVVVIHVIFCTFTTFLLLLTTTPEPTGAYLNNQLSLWATFLGVTSGALAAIQYYPQLMYTYNLKLVGALSIPMMIIQSPGGWLMVVSIALRPGTDWTSWIMYAVSGTMQAILLIMCLFWKARQRRLGIDDFGHPLPTIIVTDSLSTDSAPVLRPGEDAPGGVIHEGVEQAMSEDVHDIDSDTAASSAQMQQRAGDEESAVVDEATPLLKKGQTTTTTEPKGWRSWLKW